MPYKLALAAGFSLLLLNFGGACADSTDREVRRGATISGAEAEVGGDAAGAGGTASGGKATSPTLSALTGGAGGALAAAGSSNGVGGAETSGGSGGVASTLGGSGGVPSTAGGSGGVLALGGALGSAGAAAPPDLSGRTTGERGCGANGCLGVVAKGAAGSVRREYWLAVPSQVDEIAAFTAFAFTAFPAGPTGSDQLTSLQSVSWVDRVTTVDWAHNFGERIRGFISPPITGNYTFWIAGDNECQFWLSSDETPANAKLVAWVPQFSSVGDFSDAEQKSRQILLEAGKFYYLDFFHREHLGNTHAAVRWSKPGESANVPGEIVPASALLTAVPM